MTFTLEYKFPIKKLKKLQLLKFLNFAKIFAKTIIQSINYTKKFFILD